jgi:hypothetical protein
MWYQDVGLLITAIPDDVEETLEYFYEKDLEDYRGAG